MDGFGGIEEDRVIGNQTLFHTQRLYLPKRCCEKPAGMIGIFHHLHYMMKVSKSYNW